MMSVTKELLTKLKEAYPDASLYHFHKILGCTKQSIYQMEGGDRQMGADTILIVCDVLGLDPQPWLLRAEIERCKSDHRRQILSQMLDRLNRSPALAALALLPFVYGLLPGFSPA